MLTVRHGLLGALLAVAVVGGGDREEKFSPEAEAEADARRTKILAEVAAFGGKEWAGSYYAGDGLGVNTTLVLAPQAGFVFEWHGCMGVYDRNYGPVTVVDGTLTLTFTFENSHDGFEGIASEFVPVTWGARVYLVPADDVIGFCGAVNSGEEPRSNMHGNYLLRRGDEAKPVEGWPAVPAAYRVCLLPEPVQAAVIAVGSSTTRTGKGTVEFRETPVTIDAGTKHGLQPGMQLYVTEPANLVEWIRLVTLEEDRAQGVMTEVGLNGDPPQVGWRLSTLPPWRTRTGMRAPR